MFAWCVLGIILGVLMVVTLWLIRKGSRVEEERDGWVSVLTLYDVEQAAQLAALLRDEGIPADIRQEAPPSQSVWLRVGFIAEINLVVPEAMRDRAVEILDEVDDSATWEEDSGSETE